MQEEQGFIPKFKSQNTCLVTGEYSTPLNEKFTQTINNKAETSKWMLKNATIFTSYEQHKRQLPFKS